MRFYFITGETPDGMPYRGTLDEAKKLARETAETETMDVHVHRVEVAIDRENILNLLNIGPGAHIDLGIVYTTRAKRSRYEG